MTIIGHSYSLVKSSTKCAPALAPDEEEGQLLAQMNFLATNKPIDAFVVDDRFINRHVYMTRGDLQTPILTSLDVIEYQVASGRLSIDVAQEHRTTPRRSGYTFVPVLEDELIYHLSQAPLDNGALVETAELRAIREAAQRLRLAKVLQVPHELAWLHQYSLSMTYAIRTIWDMESDPNAAKARCEWVLGQLDIRGWASVVEREVAVQFSVICYAGILHSLCYALNMTPERQNDSFHRWIDERILNELKETEPEIFGQIMASAAELFCNTLKVNGKENE